MAKIIKLEEIANRIAAHLKRFEEDLAINLNQYTQGNKYYCSYSWSSGSRVFVRYISYQCKYSLNKTEALAYLEWLDAGNVGQHHKMNAVNAQLNHRKSSGEIASH